MLRTALMGQGMDAPDKSILFGSLATAAGTARIQRFISSQNEAPTEA